ncbi:MAG: phosphatidylglycerol lysyltransferase domain-containing protein [Methylacidiphilales bacterium]|nr:phosphatidylglycerol lysyltransferase domain-containing protein [Candidatus Methylacidiphilales bacterium]
MSTPASQSEVMLTPTVGESPSESLLPNDKSSRAVSGASWGIVLLAWLVRLSAFINLISSLLPEKPKLVYWLEPWMPFEISEGIRLRMFLTSLLLFILASGLARGKRTAWLLTMATLTIAPILHLGYVDIWPQVLINLGLIVFLLLHHRHFVVRSDQRSIRSALIICSILAVALLAFGTARLHNLVDETSGGDDWGACMQTALELVLVQNTHTQQAQTLTTLHFFSILRVGGITIALVGLFLTLRPVLLLRRAHARDREKVQRLIDQYGDDPFDAYTLLDDKSYFFSGDDLAVIPYAVSGNFAVALANPIGHPSTRHTAIVDFVSFCRQQDWEPIFYAATDELIPDYKQAGLSLFKIGEGARLKTDKFDLKGQEFQNLRTIRNRAHRLGIQFRWYDAGQAADESLERQLSVISQLWLEIKKAREMSFDMGSFSIEDIRRYGAAVALDPTGKPLAFATWRPFARGNGRVLDLMRALPQARNVMDFVLIESISHFNSTGVTRINLGLAPLANTEESPSRLVAEEKMVQFLFENLNHIYGYKSLFEFKRKYRPHWRGRYVAYRRGVHLPLVGLALVRVHAPAGIWKFLFP